MILVFSSSQQIICTRVTVPSQACSKIILTGERGRAEFPFGITGDRSPYISVEFSPMHFKFLKMIFSGVLLKFMLRVLHAVSL